MNLTTTLLTFLKEYEWDINKLKGEDVLYCIQKNVDADELSVISKEELLIDSYIRDYGLLNTLSLLNCTLKEIH